jgi:hypothetical protein
LAQLRPIIPQTVQQGKHFEHGIQPWVFRRRRLRVKKLAGTREITPGCLESGRFPVNITGTQAAVRRRVKDNSFAMAMEKIVGRARPEKTGSPRRLACASLQS